MKKRMKGLIIPTIYLLIMALSITSMNLLSNTLNKKNINNGVTKLLNGEDSVPVVNVDNNEEIIIIPVEEEIEISKYFYEINDEKEMQTKSLIYYKKTYMQNTGYLYTNDEKFNVFAVLDGTIKSIKTDEILGNYVVVEHDKELITTYYNLDEVVYKVGDQIKQGQIIGVSSPTKLEQEKAYSMLFEVYYEGLIMNPKEFFTIDLSSFD